MNILNKLIGSTSKTHLSKYPLWISYNPQYHLLKGFEIRQIINNIEIGDILLRRFNGYLNSIFTPGYWGHSAIYYKPNTILHSVSAGVVEEDILDFCRTDSICVLRTEGIDIDSVIEKCFEFKNDKIQYDYQFEDDDDEFYCTELINECFNHLFNNDFEGVLNKNVLLPDGIYDSSYLDKIIEFLH